MTQDTKGPNIWNRRKVLGAGAGLAASPFMFNIARAQEGPIKIGFPVPLTGP
jgi:branched-chain amino acid transport system substrate-binding protein